MVSCDFKNKEKSLGAAIKIEKEVPQESKFLDSITRFTIDTFIQNRSKETHLSGTFLFAKGDKIYANAFGKARYLKGEDVKVEDVFQLASVSKLITSLCILKLVEEGKLKITDTVGNIIPGFRYNNITIHELLTHTSGLPEYTYFTDNAWAGNYATKHVKDAYCVLNESKQTAYFSPGKHFNYRNTNYMLLAYIAEIKTGLAFPKIVKKYVIIPAGLDSLHVYEKDKRVTEEYPVWGMRADNSLIPDHPLNHICGDKSIYANVFDLFGLYKAIMNGKIINEKTKELLLTPYAKVKKVNEQFYCYGLRKVKLGKENWYYHNGWWHGFRTYFWFNIEKDQCAILLTNRLVGGFVHGQDMVKVLGD